MSRSATLLVYPGGVFGRSKDSQSVASAPTTVGQNAGETPRKGHPTPKRKTAEAANKRPHVPDDRKTAAKSARGKQREQRDREFAALRSGDPRFLPAKDQGPVRKYVRDFVDARWNLGEFFLPAALFLLVAQMSLTKANPSLALVALLALYLFSVIMVIDVVIMWFLLRRRLAKKFDAGAVPRGTAFYAVMRVFQLRPSRLPKPQVKHGQFPV